MQVLRWVYGGLANSFQDMTDLPLATRQKLNSLALFSSVSELLSVTSRDGTRKALLCLDDGHTVEGALLPSSKAGGHTVCVSSQVGCPVGCCFCATGHQGFERNLIVAEMVDQVLYFARGLGYENHLTNVVFMGMGEPMANYENVIEAIRRFNAPWGLRMGARNITISTAGMVPGIEKLSKEKIRVGLAVSLHAADDKLRTQLIPLNKKYPLKELIPAVRRYTTATGRRVSFEYCIINNINDGMDQARGVARLIEGMNAHVNLIAANPSCRGYDRPTPERVIAFESELKRMGVNTTLRRSYGADIEAACGQLRSRDCKDRNAI
jgi:23S rRNA (adenine2503-C2)-methyltransferase